jgi:hypothetical protein
MAKEPPPERPSHAKAAVTDDQLLSQAMQFFERLNDRARTTPALPELDDAAENALASFQATAARLQVLKPE